MIFLHEFFEDGILSRSSWLRRSFDRVFICDVFFFLKDRVFSTPPPGIGFAYFRTNECDTANGIGKKMFWNTMDRLKLCVEQREQRCSRFCKYFSCF